MSTLSPEMPPTNESATSHKEEADQNVCKCICNVGARLESYDIELERLRGKLEPIDLQYSLKKYEEVLDSLLEPSENDYDDDIDELESLQKPNKCKCGHQQSDWIANHTDHFPVCRYSDGGHRDGTPATTPTDHRVGQQQQHDDQCPATASPDHHEKAIVQCATLLGLILEANGHSQDAGHPSGPVWHPTACHRPTGKCDHPIRTDRSVGRATSAAGAD